MAFFTGSIHSANLEMNTSIRVIIPQGDCESRKTLYLLHGLSDDSSAWTRYTKIEVYANEHNFTVIMPEVQRSFYTDMKYGGNYFSYVSDELPKICSNLFGIKQEREKTFIAGLSMGGYGALKCGLSRPEQYAACASFSGVVDIRRRLKEAGLIKESNAYYGVEIKNAEIPESDDLFALSKKTNELPTSEKPRIFISCGNKDFLLADNHRYKEVMDTLEFDFQYMEWQGDHTWDFWDRSVRYALDFFDGK